ncbi:MAG: hypothetical protein Q7S07_02570 [Candidatus Omnitrophota bacterium]|nr:hypothetical protein [Candidatus Omnitrophota bacterium]
MTKGTIIGITKGRAKKLNAGTVLALTSFLSTLGLPADFFSDPEEIYYEDSEEDSPAEPDAQTVREAFAVSARRIKALIETARHMPLDQAAEFLRDARDRLSELQNVWRDDETKQILLAALYSELASTTRYLGIYVARERKNEQRPKIVPIAEATNVGPRKGSFTGMNTPGQFPDDTKNTPPRTHVFAVTNSTGGVPQSNASPDIYTFKSSDERSTCLAVKEWIRLNAAENDRIVHLPHWVFEEAEYSKAGFLGDHGFVMISEGEPVAISVDDRNEKAKTFFILESEVNDINGHPESADGFTTVYHGVSCERALNILGNGLFQIPWRTTFSDIPDYKRLTQLKHITLAFRIPNRLLLEQAVPPSPKYKSKYLYALTLDESLIGCRLPDGLRSSLEEDASVALAKKLLIAEKSGFLMHVGLEYLDIDATLADLAHFETNDAIEKIRERLILLKSEAGKVGDGPKSAIPAAAAAVANSKNNAARNGASSGVLPVGPEGDKTVPTVEGDDKPVEEVRLPDKVEVSAKAGGETNIGSEGVTAELNRQPVNVKGDEAAVPDHRVTELTSGVVDTQRIGELRKEYGSARPAVDISLGLQSPLRPAHLNFNDRIKLILVLFKGKLDDLLHRRWLNSSAPGTEKNKGINFGYLRRALSKASLPVNISPWQIMMDWWEYFLTKLSKFAATNASLSRTFKAIAFSLNSPETKDSTSDAVSQARVLALARVPVMSPKRRPRIVPIAEATNVGPRKGPFTGMNTPGQFPGDMKNIPLRTYGFAVPNPDDSGTARNGASPQLPNQLDQFNQALLDRLHFHNFDRTGQEQITKMFLTDHDLQGMLRNDLPSGTHFLIAFKTTALPFESYSTMLSEFQQRTGLSFPNLSPDTIVINIGLSQSDAIEWLWVLQHELGHAYSEFTAGREEVKAMQKWIIGLPKKDQLPASDFFQAFTDFTNVYWQIESGYMTSALSYVRHVIKNVKKDALLIDKISGWGRAEILMDYLQQYLRIKPLELNGHPDAVMYREELDALYLEKSRGKINRDNLSAVRSGFAQIIPDDVMRNNGWRGDFSRTVNILEAYFYTAFNRHELLLQFVADYLKIIDILFLSNYQLVDVYSPKLVLEYTAKIPNAFQGDLAKTIEVIKSVIPDSELLRGSWPYHRPEVMEAVSKKLAEVFKEQGAISEGDTLSVAPPAAPNPNESRVSPGDAARNGASLGVPLNNAARDTRNISEGEDSGSGGVYASMFGLGYLVELTKNMAAMVKTKFGPKKSKASRVATSVVRSDEHRTAGEPFTGEEIDFRLLRPGAVIILGGKSYKVIPRNFDHGRLWTRLVEEVSTGKKFIIKQRLRKNEEQACMSLKHPCHTKMYAVYEEEKVLLMADYGTLTFREHIHNSAKIGVPLKKWLADRVNEIIWLYEALDEMHTKGMRHTDLGRWSHILYSGGLPHIVDYHSTVFSGDSFYADGQNKDIVAVAMEAKAIVTAAMENYGQTDYIDKLDVELRNILSGTMPGATTLSAGEAIRRLSVYLGELGDIPPAVAAVPNPDDSGVSLSGTSRNGASLNTRSILVMGVHEPPLLREALGDPHTNEGQVPDVLGEGDLPYGAKLNVVHSEGYETFSGFRELYTVDLGELPGEIGHGMIVPEPRFSSVGFESWNTLNFPHSLPPLESLALGDSHIASRNDANTTSSVILDNNHQILPVIGASENIVTTSFAPKDKRGIKTGLLNGFGDDAVPGDVAYVNNIPVERADSQKSPSVGTSIPVYTIDVNNNLRNGAPTVAAAEPKPDDSEVSRNGASRDAMPLVNRKPNKLGPGPAGGMDIKFYTGHGSNVYSSGGDMPPLKKNDRDALIRQIDARIDILTQYIKGMEEPGPTDALAQLVWIRRNIMTRVRGIDKIKFALETNYTFRKNFQYWEFNERLDFIIEQLKAIQNLYRQRPEFFEEDAYVLTYAYQAQKELSAILNILGRPADYEYNSPALSSLYGPKEGFGKIINEYLKDIDMALMLEAGIVEIVRAILNEGSLRERLERYAESIPERFKPELIERLNVVDRLLQDIAIISPSGILPETAKTPEAECEERSYRALGRYPTRKEFAVIWRAHLAHAEGEKGNLGLPDADGIYRNGTLSQETILKKIRILKRSHLFTPDQIRQLGYYGAFGEEKRDNLAAAAAAQPAQEYLDQEFTQYVAEIKKYSTDKLETCYYNLDDKINKGVVFICWFQFMEANTDSNSALAAELKPKIEEYIRQKMKEDLEYQAARGKLAGVETIDDVSVIRETLTQVISPWLDEVQVILNKYPSGSTEEEQAFREGVSRFRYMIDNALLPAANHWVELYEKADEPPTAADAPAGADLKKGEIRENKGEEGMASQLGGSIQGRESGIASLARSEIDGLARNDGIRTSEGFEDASNEARRIYDENLRPEYMPAITGKTILCHIIPDSILPAGQGEKLLNPLESSMRGIQYVEKVAYIGVNNSGSFMKQVQEAMARVEDSYRREYGEEAFKDYIVEFDVACPSTEEVVKIREEKEFKGKVRALAFEPCKDPEVDAVQAHGIILALRALRTDDLARLKAAYLFLGGEKPGLEKITTIEQFIIERTFKLPSAKKLDNNKRKFNELISRYIREAA